MSPGRD